MGQQRCMGLRFCQDQGESRECRNQLGRHKWTVYHSKRDHSGVLHNNKWILKRTQQGNLQVLHKCNDISFGYIHIWNWSFFTQPQFEAKKYSWKHIHSRQNCVYISFFHVPIGKFYTWLNFFTQPAIVMIVTNIRCGYIHAWFVNNHQYVRTVKI